MANNMKLELVLLGKDFLGKILGKDIGFLKNFRKEGEAAAKAAEKLNAAKKKLSTNSGARGDTDNLRRRTGETNKAAAAQEKLNNAIKREPKRGADGRMRDGGGSGNNFEQDLISGGTGAGMLWAAKQGMTSAMSKQEALTDLYNAFYRSSLGASELNSQMREGEKIADVLGNKLPGTTADYLQMFAVMKERGIEADSILKGAGKSAAYLAVANKEDRLDVGSNIARFGQMFNLKTENEYMGAAELMSRAKTTYGINSSELMEAVKDFSGRTGKGLGLDGGKGAEDTLRYLAFLRSKTGMEGLTVGTSASSFFGQYLQAKQKKQDPTQELKKLTGVDLQIFDKKGQFLGLENAVKEFSKLKGKLSDEQMVGFGNKIAGEEGSAVFQAMVKNGEQFTQFNQEMTESASLQEKSAKNAENLTNKVEALTGSLSNLGAAGFGPLVEPLGKIADQTNTVVGSLTEMAKAYPTSAATTAGVLTLGGAFLALKGGTGVLSRLTNMTAFVGGNATDATKKVGGLRNSLTSLPTALKIGLTIEMLGLAWEQVEKLRETVNQFRTTNAGLDDAGAMAYKAQQYEDQSLKANGQSPNYKVRAQEALSLLQQGNKEFEKAIDPTRMGWYESYSRLVGSIASGENLGFYTPGGGANRWKNMSPEQQQTEKTQYSNLVKQYSAQPVPSIFKDALDRATKEMLGADTLRRRIPMLNDPNTMSSFRKDSLPSLNLSGEMMQHVNKMLERAFPESFKQSNQQLLIEQARLAEQSGMLGQSFTNLMQPTDGLNQSFTNAQNSTNTAVNGINNLGNSANAVAFRLNNLQITPPTFAPIQIPTFGALPGRARGGGVTGGKPYMVGENGAEMFVPNRSGSIVSNDVLLRGRKKGGSSVHVNFSPTVNVSSDNPNAGQLMSEIRRELAFLKRELQEELSPRRMARKVAFEADRDSERV